MVRILVLLTLAASLGSCALGSKTSAVHGVLDLRNRDWSGGSVSLGGEWAFGSSWRTIPDQWTGSEAGGTLGRGSGTYRLTVLLPDRGPALALRYFTASSAFAIRANGVEIVRVGTPSIDPTLTVPAYLPGTVALPTGPVLELEILVSNQVYRAGGLWSVPVLGPKPLIETERWQAETAAFVLATVLAVIGFTALLLYSLRRSEKTFIHLGFFALLVALRSLVTGEYTIVRIFPGIPFDLIVRLEYLTAYLLLPAGVRFFEAFFPGLWTPKIRAIMVWPSRIFASLVLFLPLELLTRSIPFYYPIALPSLILGTVLVVRKIRTQRRIWGLLAGVSILVVTALGDMAAAAFFAITGNLVPWGLGAFVVLQASTMARRFLATVERNETLLAEKEFLVMEVHHRVKNSLQIVASLVSLQSNRTQDPQQKAVFTALRHRITAIALVHEKLYGQGVQGRPDMGEYLRDLMALQYPGDGLQTQKVVWQIKMASLTAEVDDCIDTGLILTELVANAHKHGLLPRGGGELSIDLQVLAGRLILEVADDGPGFPVGFLPEASTGLGFRLILALLQRHDGKLTFVSGAGGKVRVDLKIPSTPE